MLTNLPGGVVGLLIVANLAILWIIAVVVGAVTTIGTKSNTAFTNVGNAMP